MPTKNDLFILHDSVLFKLINLIRGAHKIVICAHRSPDGDALGASLGLAGYLRRLGKSTAIIMPNPFPDFLKWLPGSNNVSFFDDNIHLANSKIKQADLIFMLDFSSLDRIKEMGSAVCESKATKIIIDHHLDPDMTAADLVFSYPSACSTCELIFKIIYQMGGYEDMSSKDAVCLYTGMMTDTGGFTYNSTSPVIYSIISLLLNKSIDKDRIYRNVFNNYSENRLRFLGYILYEKLRFYESRRASIMTITREEMKRFHFIRGDGEGLVNMPLQVRGMRLSISLREDTEKDVIRVSLRSVDDFPCNEMAEQFFNGGGHLNASGGELPFPLEEAILTAEKAIEAFKYKL